MSLDPTNSSSSSSSSVVSSSSSPALSQESSTSSVSTVALSTLDISSSSSMSTFSSSSTRTVDPNEECRICLERLLDDGQKSIQAIFHKNHGFHADCLINWLKIKDTCPNCRKALPDKDTSQGTVYANGTFTLSVGAQLPQISTTAQASFNQYIGQQTTVALLQGDESDDEEVEELDDEGDQPLEQFAGRFLYDEHGTYAPEREDIWNQFLALPTSSFPQDNENDDVSDNDTA